MDSKGASGKTAEKEVKVKENVALATGDTKSPEKSAKDAPKVIAASTRGKKIPIIDCAAETAKPVKVPVPQKLQMNLFKELSYEKEPLVLSTHLVPSISIELFELLAALLEDSTETPVVLLHESRNNRPVASDLVHIAILPAGGEWKEGNLLPIGMVFKHRLNKEHTPGVYADIIVAQDAAQNVNDIMDLRGHKVAIADRHLKVGTAGLLFSYLKSKGENPSFFGNVLDSETQLAALQMVAGKQTEVGVLEAPVINCHKENLPGASALLILDSLGPLPPYQIMLNAKLSSKIAENIKKSLLSVNSSAHWLERLKAFGITGFAEYSKDNYDVEDMKSVITSVRYY